MAVGTLEGRTEQTHWATISRGRRDESEKEGIQSGTEGGDKEAEPTRWQAVTDHDFTIGESRVSFIGGDREALRRTELVLQHEAKVKGCL